MTRREVINALLENAKLVSKKYEEEIKKWDGLVLSEKGLFIPGYIPYIGNEYFDSTPKIINYALSQNLHPNYGYINKYAENWHKQTNFEKALNRQNISFKHDGTVKMWPFDTGHLPILSGIFIYLTTKEKNINPINRIAATNLSKFSFRTKKNRTTDSLISLKKCYDWFTKKELELLNPKYIICASKKVFNIIKQEKKYQPILVSFPSLLVINRWYKNDLTSDDKKTLEIIISIFSEDFLNKSSSYNNHKKIIEIIRRDAYYFVRMYERIKGQL